MKRQPNGSASEQSQIATPEISVIIPTYKRSDSMQRTLRGLFSQTIAPQIFEIVVVGGRDDDETEAMIRDLHTRLSDAQMLGAAPRLRFFRQHKRGPAEARNIGACEAHGQLLVFLDDDCLPSPDWLRWIKEDYDEHPEVGGIGGTTQHPPKASKDTEWVRQAQVFAFNERNARLGTRFGQPGYVLHYSGANRSYRRDVFWSVGGFDEELHGCEDADLAWRLYKQGVKVYYDPRLTITHYDLQSPLAMIKRAYRYGRSQYRFQKKQPDYPFLHKMPDVRYLWAALYRRLRLAPLASAAESAGARRPNLSLVGFIYGLAISWGMIHEMLYSKLGHLFAGGCHD